MYECYVPPPGSVPLYGAILSSKSTTSLEGSEITKYVSSVYLKAPSSLSDEESVPTFLLEDEEPPSNLRKNSLIELLAKQSDANNGLWEASLYTFPSKNATRLTSIPSGSCLRDLSVAPPACDTKEEILLQRYTSFEDTPNTSRSMKSNVQQTRNGQGNNRSPEKFSRTSCQLKDIKSQRKISKDKAPFQTGINSRQTSCIPRPKTITKGCVSNKSSAQKKSNIHSVTSQKRVATTEHLPARNKFKEKAQKKTVPSRNNLQQKIYVPLDKPTCSVESHNYGRTRKKIPNSKKAAEVSRLPSKERISTFMENYNFQEDGINSYMAPSEDHSSSPKSEAFTSLTSGSSEFKEATDFNPNSCKYEVPPEKTSSSSHYCRSSYVSYEQPQHDITVDRSYSLQEDLNSYRVSPEKGAASIPSSEITASSNYLSSSPYSLSPKIAKCSDSTNYRNLMDKLYAELDGLRDKSASKYLRSKTNIIKRKSTRVLYTCESESRRSIVHISCSFTANKSWGWQRPVTFLLIFFIMVSFYSTVY